MAVSAKLYFFPGCTSASGNHRLSHLPAVLTFTRCSFVVWPPRLSLLLQLAYAVALGRRRQALKISAMRPRVLERHVGW